MAIGEIDWRRLLGDDWVGNCLVCRKWFRLEDANAGRVAAWTLPGHVGPFCKDHLTESPASLTRLLEVGADWWGYRVSVEPALAFAFPGLAMPAGAKARISVLLDNLKNRGYAH